MCFFAGRKNEEFHFESNEVNEIHENLKLRSKIEVLEKENKKKNEELQEARRQIDSLLSKEVQSKKQTMSASGKKNQGSGGADLFVDNSNIISRMEKLEEFYKNKIKIVEDGRKDLESEISRLEGEKTLLMNSNEEARRKMHRHLEEITENYKRELMDQGQKFEEQVHAHLAQYQREKRELEEELSLKMHTYQREVESLTGIVESLEEKTKELEQKNVGLEEEKNELTEQYNQLLTIHNNMIELDLKKNEKTLSGYSKTPQQTHKNNGYLSHSHDQTLLNSEMHRHGPNSANEDILGILNHYKVEFDKIKENNEKIRHQFFDEIAQMKKALKKKEKENEFLKTELRLYKSEFEKSKN